MDFCAVCRVSRRDGSGLVIPAVCFFFVSSRIGVLSYQLGWAAGIVKDTFKTIFFLSWRRVCLEVKRKKKKKLAVGRMLL